MSKAKDLLARTGYAQGGAARLAAPREEAEDWTDRLFRTRKAERNVDSAMERKPPETNDEVMESVRTSDLDPDSGEPLKRGIASYRKGGRAKK